MVLNHPSTDFAVDVFSFPVDHRIDWPDLYQMLYRYRMQCRKHRNQIHSAAVALIILISNWELRRIEQANREIFLLKSTFCKESQR